VRSTHLQWSPPLSPSCWTSKPLFASTPSTAARHVPDKARIASCRIGLSRQRRIGSLHWTTSATGRSVRPGEHLGRGQSLRSAVFGWKRVARRAGRHVVASATSNTVPIVPAITNGSSLSTLKSWVVSNRAAAAAAEVPRTSLGDQARGLGRRLYGDTDPPGRSAAHHPCQHCAALRHRQWATPVATRGILRHHRGGLRDARMLRAAVWSVAGRSFPPVAGRFQPGASCARRRG
jgi:hypothetical protein